ncbi:protoheme IX farnesyltransferase [Motilibacter rhizosphaerae]|uniref:Protoheme IX farnesyltransferase n=1 Tax=Motilibacter rhizosphaerae TaxID=598652 RepID=A0A4Q7NG77_9ACTN|nr:heme o synthase [Motilibacter rhizosphaerae]RZS82809.1 protoheme IX farnesyltransferase [Motilibacter rhizosphaerae]
MTAVDPRPALPVPAHGSSAPTLAAEPVAARSRGPVDTVRAYVALTKPRIIELLLVTTIPTMLLAAHGLPGLGVTVATLVGGFLAAGSANALNCYLDRDIDKVMHRTERRPLATGAVSPREALVFGLVLGALSVGLFTAVVNLLSAGLALAAIAFYVLVYTLVLKRRTPQNIVWGGAAGCMPVLIGWAAVTDSLSWAPVVLFLVVFLWTPPHYWPLAMRFREDYGRAGVPMLPVVAGDVAVARQIVAYSWAMVAASVALWPVAGTGWVYGVASLALGAAFLVEAHALLGRARRGLAGAALKPMRLFHGSISYLSLLFVAVAAAPLLPGR